MADELAAVSPKVLKWARTSLGLDLYEVSHELGKNIELVEGWERGDGSPTYAQLEKLAYTVYKRPMAMFFMPEPPSESNVKTEFRTFFGFNGNKLEKDTHLAIRDGKAKQLYLNEFADSSNAQSFIEWLQQLRASNQPLEIIARDVRNRLKVSEISIAKTKKPEEALELWRDAIEETGIFVFKRSFKQNNISGFCLLHEKFPVIFLNNKTSFTRQIFTILHELAHLAFDVSGVCSVDTTYIPLLEPADRRIEEWCDKFAAEVLVPNSSFLALMGKSFNQERIESIAKQFRVSPAVIAWKSFDLNLIDKTWLNELMQEYFPDNWRTYKKAEDDNSSGGGDYYNTQLQYLSRRYLIEAYQKYSTGKISSSAFSDYLGVKVTSLAGLESRLVKS